MNTLFNTALKQSTSLKRDLSSPPALLTPSLLGQISASLTSFSRTLDSYSSLIKTELNAAKKAKAEERLQNFRQELQEFREGYLELKRQGEEAEAVGQKNELFGRRPHHTGTPDNPYANSTASPTNVGGGVNGWQGGQMSAHAPDVTREQHALREQTFFQNTHSALDEYLARGQAVLGDLSQQREVMKGTQKRLRSVANTLGVSGETIRMVERRAKQDKWIFGIGVVVFFGFCWGVLKIFR